MHCLRRALFALTLLLTALSILPSEAHAQKARYTNRVNERFATVSSGPQSSLIVDVPRRATDTQIRDAIATQVRAEWNAKSRTLASAVRRWEQSGMLKPGTMIPMSSLVMVRKDGNLVTPAPTRGRQFGGGTLTFRYTGFNATDQELLQRFIADAMPRIQAVYGAPARTGQVEIVNAGNLFNSQIPEVRRFAYGVYDVSNNRIMLPIFQNPRGTLQAMLLNLVHAFHGPAVFQYDAWEQGFARAVAAIVLRDPIFNQNYGMDDPSANFLYSLMPYYDLLNQAPLGNSTFFPPSQNDVPVDGQITVVKMLWARMGMSGAAWMKVYIENQSFFRDFNAAYYAQVNPGASPSLAGNVPALKNIAAPLLPSGVEGIPWTDWYARQFVLDTSISTGNKLYAFTLPGQPDSEGRQNTAVTLVYYQTQKNGDEILQGGRAFATYFDSSNGRLTLGPQAEQANIVDGEGGLTATTTNTAGTDATRLTMDFTINNLTTRVYVPVGFGGDFQGVLLLNNSARNVTVKQTSLPPVNNRNKTGNVEGAAFGVSMASGGSDLSITEVEVSDGTAIRRWRINTADGLYYAILRDGSKGGGVVTLSKTFDSSTIPYLVTFPLRPLSPDPTTALGLAPSDFLLTYWDPLRPTYETVLAGQSTMSSIQPGRAYWLKLAPQNNAPQVTVSITGIPPATDNDLVIPCVFGWNLIGSPFDQAIELGNIQVKVLQDDPISWDDAVNQNLVAAQPFAFDRVTGQYSQVTGFAGDWQGYWLRVFAPSGVTLILPGPDAATRAVRRTTRKVEVAEVRPEWSVRLTARQESASGQAAVRLGAAKGATRSFDNRLDVEMPPPIVPQLSMDIAAASGSKTAGGRLVSDFRDENSANRGTWTVRVATTATGNVTLNWDNIGTLSRRTNMTLIDRRSGQRIGMRSRSTYTTYAEAGTNLLFDVVTEPGVSIPLQVTNLITTTSRATGGITFAGSVSRSSQISVEVTALNGKSIRQLAGTRSQDAGVFRVSWDGRSVDGASVPPGAYTVLITAQTDEGERVQVRRVVTLLR